MTTRVRNASAGGLAARIVRGDSPLPKRQSITVKILANQRHTLLVCKDFFYIRYSFFPFSVVIFWISSTESPRISASFSAMR